MIIAAVFYFITSMINPDFGVNFSNPIKIAVAIAYVCAVIYFFTYPIGEN